MRGSTTLRSSLKVGANKIYCTVLSFALKSSLTMIIPLKWPRIDYETVYFYIQKLKSEILVLDSGNDQFFNLVNITAETMR